jgi:hypothetical protein
LDALAGKAVARLSDVFAATWNTSEGDWYGLYLAEWYSLGGRRDDRKGRRIVIGYLETIEKSLDAGDPKERRKLEALRAARERLEAAAK